MRTPRPAARTLKEKRCPTVLRVPDQHWQEKHQSYQPGQVGFLAQPPLSGTSVCQKVYQRTHSHECHRVLGKHSKSHAYSDSPPGFASLSNQGTLQKIKARGPCRKQGSIRSHKKTESKINGQDGHEQNASKGGVLFKKIERKTVHETSRDGPTH